MNPHPESMSHNACSVDHFNVSYWIQIDRGDFPVTDLVGEFSIIDPSFQVETYGNRLISDRSFVRNYAIRRCFVEFCNYLPAHLDGVSVSFAVLRDVNSVLRCRCFFGCSSNSFYSELSPVDFELSLSLENVRATKTQKKEKP